MTTPEECIEDGIFNRLTHATNGITIEAGEYCSNDGGVQLYQGQVDLEVENMIEWALPGVAEGPIVLIVAGDDVEYDTDYREVAIGTYAVRLYIATQNYRTAHEGMSGDAAGATRKPGIYQVKSDILDRILNFGIVQDSNGAWEDSAWVVSGRLLVKQRNLFLYELTLNVKVGSIHTMTPTSSMDRLEGIDATLTKEPDAGTDEEFEVGVKIDVP